MKYGEADVLEIDLCGDCFVESLLRRTIWGEPIGENHVWIFLLMQGMTRRAWAFEAFRTLIRRLRGI